LDLRAIEAVQSGYNRVPPATQINSSTQSIDWIEQSPARTRPVPLNAGLGRTPREKDTENGSAANKQSDVDVLSGGKTVRSD
jgi:hypothetical protein